MPKKTRAANHHNTKALPQQLPPSHDEDAVAEEEDHENDGQSADRPPPPATGHLVSLDLPNQAAHPSQGSWPAAAGASRWDAPQQW